VQGSLKFNLEGLANFSSCITASEVRVCVKDLAALPRPASQIDCLITLNEEILAKQIYK